MTQEKATELHDKIRSILVNEKARGVIIIEFEENNGISQKISWVGVGAGNAIDSINSASEYLKKQFNYLT